MIGTAIFLGILFPDKLPVSARRYVIVWLPSLLPPPAPVVNSPRNVGQVATPKLELPGSPAPPVFAATDLELPKIRPVAPPLMASLPQPLLPAPSFAQPNAAPKVQIIEVHTGTFGGASEPVATQRQVEQVQTGGFGSLQGFRGEAQGESAGNVPRLGSAGFPGGPGVGNGTGGAQGIPGGVASEGLRGRAQSESAGNIPKLGSFGLPAGPGARNGGGGAQGVQGVVVSAGFGRGVGSGYAPDGGGTGVAMGGFQKVGQVAQFPMKSLPAPQPTEFQPVELLSKPSPVYTEEGRRLRIQGEVTLSVVFQAGGAIRILEVVNSLGHGLDQAAEQAASQIHFKPARHNGKPVDFPATLRIEFRLADQTI